LSFIYLAPGNNVEGEVLRVMEASVREAFQLPTQQLASFAEPDSSYDPARKQYSSPDLLRELAEHVPADATRVLGVTERDLFIPMLSFIFGQAQLGGQVALVSLARLRQEFYGMEPDAGLLADRACKEALHELGHTFGLTHCVDRTCTMSLSTGIRQVDLKAPRFCSSCVTLLDDSMAALDRRSQGISEAEEER
jgi:archaemetzincin